LDYKIKTEKFEYLGDKRSRPVRVVGYVPTEPNNAPTRQNVMPLALHSDKSEFPDFPPHNTVRGHLIGLDSLGGEELPENLVPMYGQFNLSTYKVQFENVLKSKVQREGVKEAVLELSIEYGGSTADPRIPIAFSFDLTVTAKNDTTEKTSGTIPHPSPEPAFVPMEEDFRKYVVELQKKMEIAKWYVEDHRKHLDRSPMNFFSGSPLIVPARDYAERPYAVIDYAMYLKDFKWFGNGSDVSIENGAEFNDHQIAAILAVNAARNAGYYKSDDLNDYVYTGTREFFKNPEVANHYYLHAHACAGNRDGVLIMSGYHQKPEIDHIMPKGNHLKPGCNACSNARVISRYLNSEDRGTYSK
jgi:hypothetical protein